MSHPVRRLGRAVLIGAPVVIALWAVSSTAQADWVSDLMAPFEEALASGSWGLALGFVFLFGIATSLTPCVYPMIAITVSVFGARQAETRGKGMLLSTSFVLGIAALFTPLGLIAAAGGAFFGEALTLPAVLIALAILFVGLALSMFGAFELTLPPKLQNRLAQVGGIGYKGAFALGFVSGLIAAPCTGPPLLALLAWISESGNMAFGGLALFVFSIGLGLLFWLVGTFAVSLPKSGRWLEWVKSFFGVVMVVMAIYYIRDLLPFDRPAERETWFGVMAAALVLVGFAAGAIHLSYHGTGTAVRLRKTLGIGLAVAGMVCTIFYLEALPKGAKIDWLHDLDEARTLATDSGRPLVVDFTASWCGACGELDRNTFSDPRVVARAAALGIVPVKVDMSPDEVTDAKTEALADYEQRGLPLVVLHDEAGEEVARVTQFVEPEEFLEMLERLN